MYVCTYIYDGFGDGDMVHTKCTAGVIFIPQQGMAHGNVMEVQKKTCALDMGSVMVMDMAIPLQLQLQIDVVISVIGIKFHYWNTP